MNRTTPVLAQDLLHRAATARIALETARRRGRMYLADPASDPASAHTVIEQMVRLLERAPEPVMGVRDAASCECCGATETVAIDLDMSLSLCARCTADLRVGSTA